MVAAAPPKIVSEIERIILGRIASGRLILPAMPAVANECLNILRDPDFQQKKLIAQLEREPMLAATVLRSGSTASFGGGITPGLDQAVSRLGAQRLKTLILEYASHELFQSTDKRISEANKKVWHHSVAVALLSRDIAALTGNPDGDGAYLGGLLHDIGKPVVAAMLLEAERGLGKGQPGWIDVGTWTTAVESTHRNVGVALATEWKIPEKITAAIRDCSDYDPGERKGISNIIRFANAIAKREGYVTGPVDAADLDAMILVGRSMIGADDDLVNRLATGLKDRLRS
jgi:putative nucleotidyltransferase with HDIG domain